MIVKSDMPKSLARNKRNKSELLNKAKNMNPITSFL